MTIAAGLGYTSPIWAGAALTLIGLGVLLGALRLARRDEPARTDASLVDAPV